MALSRSIMVSAAMLALLMTTIVRAQPSDTLKPRMKRTAFYLTLGFVGPRGSLFPIYGATNINLERMFLDNSGHKFSSFWVRTGGGIFLSPLEEIGGYNGSLELMTITGKGKHHFEICLGTTLYYNDWGYKHIHGDWELEHEEEYPWRAEPAKTDFMTILPSGSFGYRYQKPGGRLLLRAGVGAPDAFYGSVGICF